MANGQIPGGGGLWKYMGYKTQMTSIVATVYPWGRGRGAWVGEVLLVKQMDPFT